MTKRKKIAFVVAVPITASAFLMGHFRALGELYDVHLICNFPDKRSRRQFEDAGVVCHRAPIERQITIVGDLRGLLAVMRILRKERFDCVHSHTPKAGLLTALAGWMTRVPNRVHIFTGQVWATRHGLMRMMLKGMDKVIATLNTKLLVDGESQRQFLIREGVLTEENSMTPAEGSVAGVRLDKYVMDTEIRRSERRRLGLKDDAVVFVFIGRLNHDKGIGELYEAFDRMAVECQKSVLLFYGMDEEGYEERVAAYANIKKGVNFFFPGVTATPYVALQAGDVFVLPTWREGFPVSVLEAQAIGLPVITTDAYGALDAMVDGVTGLRCHVNDPEGLYDCMKLYYHDEALRRAHGVAGRKRVEEYFSSEVVSKAWVEIYRGMMGV